MSLRSSALVLMMPRISSACTATTTVVRRPESSRGRRASTPSAHAIRSKSQRGLFALRIPGATLCPSTTPAGARILTVRDRCPELSSARRTPSWREASTNRIQHERMTRSGSGHFNFASVPDSYRKYLQPPIFDPWARELLSVAPPSRDSDGLSDPSLLTNRAADGLCRRRHSPRRALQTCLSDGWDRAPASSRGAQAPLGVGSLHLA